VAWGQHEPAAARHDARPGVQRFAQQLAFTGAEPRLAALLEQLSDAAPALGFEQRVEIRHGGAQALAQGARHRALARAHEADEGDRALHVFRHGAEPSTGLGRDRARRHARRERRDRRETRRPKTATATRARRL